MKRIARAVTRLEGITIAQNGRWCVPRAEPLGGERSDVEGSDRLPTFLAALGADGADARRARRLLCYRHPAGATVPTAGGGANATTRVHHASRRRGGVAA